MFSTKSLLMVLALSSMLFPQQELNELSTESSESGLFDLPDGTKLPGVATLKGKLPKGCLSIFSAALGGAGAVACFKSEAAPVVRLAFETGTPDNPCSTLTAFTFSSDSAAAADTSCSPSPLLSVKTSTENGLSLGMTQPQLIKKIGKPSKVTPDYVVYFFESFKTYTAAEKAKIQAEMESAPPKGEWNYQTLIARFKDRKMDYLRVSLTTETEN